MTNWEGDKLKVLFCFIYFFADWEAARLLTVTLTVYHGPSLRSTGILQVIKLL